MQIRTRQAGDAIDIRNVIAEAFDTSDHGHNGEADLVDQIHASGNDMVSLVALDRTNVLGHVLFSPAQITGESGVVHGVGLAPVSVSPSVQRQGIGSALINDGLKQLRAMQADFAVVIGDPAYYQRFGFIPASQHELTHDFDGIPQEFLMVQSLREDSSQIPAGTVRYCEQFYDEPTA